LQGAAGASPFTLNGTSAVYTAGNVGIGNSSPQNALSVFGNQAAIVSSGVDATSPGQAGTGTPGFGGSTPSALFDKQPGSYYTLGLGGEFTVDFGTANLKTIVEYRIDVLGGTSPSGAYLAVSWTVSASNDGTNFVTLDTRTNVPPALSSSYSFTNATPYRYYRFSMTNRNGFGVVITELQLFPSVPAPGTVLEVTHNGRVGILTSSPQYALDVNGEIRGTLVSPSDARWKRDIQPLTHALDTVTKLEGVSYHWRTDEFPERHFPTDRAIGVIAQQVEQVAPELVSTDSNGNKGVNYPLTVPLLIEAVKELKRQNDALRQSQDELRAQMQQLQSTN
jgi:hypothetical protein